MLCSEWIFGRPLAQSSPAEIRRLVPVGVECFLVQLLELGRFHSDPHPGNLFVEDEHCGGGPQGRRRLVLLDFGLCATLARCVRCVRARVRECASVRCSNVCCACPSVVLLRCVSACVRAWVDGACGVGGGALS